MEKCIHHNIGESYVSKIHFNDLLLLVLRLDIDELTRAINTLAKSKKGNDNIKNISAEDAVKMLKG